jgi:hypothetical protein
MGGHGRYTQVKISVNPELASSFKRACASANVSMASVLSQFMSGYCRSGTKQKPLAAYGTRRQRRAAVGRMLRQLEMIKDAEEQYMGNIPENLQGSANYENAEQSVSLIEEGIDILASVY